MLRKRPKPNKAPDAHLWQASWSLPGLVVAGNMLYALELLLGSNICYHETPKSTFTLWVATCCTLPRRRTWPGRPERRH
jgi:hypothetical protein